MTCKYCSQTCTKAGKQKNGAQRYCCTACNKHQQQAYKYKAYHQNINAGITEHLCEGAGIRSIARLLRISATTVISRIKAIAAAIQKPPVKLHCKAEVDEMRTFIKSKQNKFWIVYALCKATRQVIDFAVGRRTKQTLSRVIETLLLANAQRISTDRLNLYSLLIPAHLHGRSPYGTNNIERSNLSLRTDLKRLTRRTICYTKSKPMLESCLKIYFWGK